MGKITIDVIKVIVILIFIIAKLLVDRTTTHVADDRTRSTRLTSLVLQAHVGSASKRSFHKS